MFDAILLMDNTPGEDFATALEEAGLYDRLDLTGRPGEAAMGVRDGLPTLAGPGLDAIGGLLSRKKKLHAFSLAAVSELDKIDGVVFPVRSLNVRVRRAGPEKGPYYRRMVTLERVRAAAPVRIDEHAPQVVAEMAGLPRLSIDPLTFSVTAEEAEILIETLPASGPVLLPPTRQEMPRGSYLAAERMVIRNAWAKKLKGAALFDLWHAESDPLLRDLLADGGGFLLHVHADRPTAAALGVWAGDEKVSNYRAGFFLNPQSDTARAGTTRPGTPPPPLNPQSDTARALIADVSVLFPASVGVEQAPVKAERQNLSEAELADPGAPADGTSRQIAALGAALDRKASGLFASLIPATTDHDRAERNFLSSFAHPGLIDPVGWRQAWFPSGLLALCGKDMPEIAGLSIDHGGPAPVAIHPPRASQSDLTRWSLLLPLGSRLLPDSAVRLDEGHELPAGDWDAGARISRTRPYPGQNLTAAGARDQEAYCLTRAAFGTSVPGLAELTLGESIRVLASRREVRVERLSGLTAGGRPVVLRDGDFLTAPLPGTSADAVFEAFVEVDPPDDERRYRLVVLPPGETTQGLDLGGYAWKQGSPVRLVRRPAYQTFSAISPWDDGYAASLISRLVELQALDMDSLHSPLAQQAFPGELLAVAGRWCEMPLDELARALSHLGWLLGHRTGVVRRVPPPARVWADRPPGEWPAALAALSVPVEGESPPDSPLLEDYDYRVSAGADGLVIHFLRERGRGRLRFRFPAADESSALTIRGPGVSSVVTLNGKGVELETRDLALSDGLELVLSPVPSPLPLIFFKKVN